jgi:two-component system, OmpR family, sensor histidine kinase VanS
VTRPPGMSVRLRLTVSYAGFLLLAGLLLLTAVWWFLLRGRVNLFVPDPADFLRVFDPRNFGPRVFLPAAALVLVFLLVFGLVGGWILAGRILAPLTRITAAARAVNSRSLTHRVALDGHRDEFRELADTFDAMLDRLERQVAEQQRFAANASHELRTPLAVTQTMLDVAIAGPDRDPAELLERLRVVNARAIQLTEALLSLSTADRRPLHTDLVDLSLLADEATETLVPLADKLGVEIHTSGSAAYTDGSTPLLLQLTTNLLQNAVAHNLPRSGQVWLTTAEQPTGPVLVVENTGPPLTAETVATLAEPFRRGSVRMHDDDAGAGLGLTIAERITSAHRGTLTLAARASGGLHVTVQLPRSRRRTPQVPYPSPK